LKVVTKIEFRVISPPSSLKLGQATYCIATAVAGAPPAGSISFGGSGGTGKFSNPTCGRLASTKTCLVSYTPSSLGTQTLTATYSNDPKYVSVSASTTIQVVSATHTSAVVVAPNNGQPTPLGTSLAFIPNGLSRVIAGIISTVSSPASLASVLSLVFILGMATLLLGSKLYPVRRQQRNLGL
jgi:hypothetical protein